MKKLKQILDSTEIDDAVVRVLRSQAPNVAGALAGAGGGPLAAGVARQVASRVLGDAEAPRDRIAEAVATGLTPEQHAELMRIEGEQSAKMAAILAGDRADARDAHADSPTPARLAYLAFFALVAAFAALLFTEPPDGTRDMLMVVIGFLVAVAKDGFGFFLGSSAGSKSKEAGLLARMR